MPSITITGTVRHQNGNPIDNIRVAAVERKFPHNRIVGESQTLNNGTFQLTIDLPAQSTYLLELREETGNVVVEKGPFGAFSSDRQVNFELSEDRFKGSNIFTATGAVLNNNTVRDWLSAGTDRPNALEDARLIAIQENLSLSETWRYLKAHELTEATQSNDTVIPAQVWYSLLKQGLPASISALSALHTDEVEAAVQRAKAANQISPDESVENLMRQWKMGLTTKALEEKPEGLEASLADIINLSGITPPQKRRLTELMAEEDVNSDDFWSQVGEIVNNPNRLARLRKSIQLAAFTGFQPSMIGALLNTNTAPEIHAVAALAYRDAQAWEAFLQQPGNTGAIPAFIKGDNESERRKKYAAGLARAAERAFPEHAFFGRLNNNGGFAQKADDMRNFFAQNPGFVFKKASIKGLTEGEGMDLTGISDTAGLLKELRSARRMMNFTDSTAAMQQLRLEGLDSAAAVSGVPRGEFIGKYAEYFQSPEEAIQAHRQAAHVASFTQLLWANHHPNQQVETAATPGGAPGLGGLTNELTTSRAVSANSPDWRLLFGSLDTCACEHCLSLYSPAAYLTDLLHFLETRSGKVFEELVRRRPDLESLSLNCENTNTPLPYVDLVIELLENMVTPPASSAIYQTTLSAPELAANPEHANPSAYARLKTAVYPWNLPFDMPLEESRIYLSHLGLSRYNLMRHVHPGGAEAAFENAGVACEFLGMSKQEWNIITAQISGNGTTEGGTWNFYGFDRSVGFSPISDPVSGGALTADNDWLETLSNRVDIFLQQTGLSYIELLPLLDCFFINPGRSKISIVSTNIEKPATCLLYELRLNSLEEADLVRLHRFVRLARRLQWSFADLDKALSSKGIRGVNADGAPKNPRIYLTEADLLYLSQVEQLRRGFGCKVEEVLSLWADMSSVPYALYSGEKTSTTPSLYERLFCDKAVINPPNPAFKINPTNLSGRIRQQASTIAAALEIDEATVFLLTTPTTNLSLANLSALYRYVMLARWLGMDVSDLRTTIDLTGINPFERPVGTAHFLQSITTIKDSKLSLQELDYLLRHRFSAAESIHPSEEEIAVFFADIIREVKKEDGTSETVVDMDEDTVIEKAISTFQLSAKAATKLLKDYLVGVAGTGTMLLQDLMSPLSIDIRKNAYIKLSKVARLLHHFKITDEEINILLDQQAAIGNIPFNDLPVTEQNTADFSGFSALNKLIRTRTELNIGAGNFVEILRLALSPVLDKGAWLSKVADLKICEAEVLQALVGSAETLNTGGMLKTNFPADFYNGDILLTVGNVYGLLKSTGLNPTIVVDVTKPELSSEAAQAVKSATKSRHSAANWHNVAKPLRDALREQQRVALVDYLLHHSPNWRSVEDLYEYLLIDVEMKPVAMTSRLKQATCSVQLFIDRVLMNLEHDSVGNPILLEAQQADEWKTWRKIYRVWEANRKIFLYPENWIEPELRDDQTPIFKDAVAALLQNELSPAVVEDVFRGYLDKLDEIARLEIVGIVRQQEAATTTEEAIDITHVFGRTQAQPHKYFHRTLENGEWTPWLPIEGDVDGDHLVPVIFNRRLCLFWLFFTQESEEKEFIDPNSKIEKANVCWKIQVAWSEYRKNVWSAKKLSKRFVKTRMTNSNTELAKYRDELFLQHYIEDGELFIHVSQRNDTKRLLLDSGTSVCQASFVFEDTSNEPEVKSDMLPLEYSLILPEHATLYKQMVRRRTGGSLRLGYEYITPQGRIVPSAQQTIINSSSNGRFRLVVQAGVAQPFQHSFVFQDNKHAFWVNVTEGRVVDNPVATTRSLQGTNRSPQPVTPDSSHIELALREAWGSDLYPPLSTIRVRQADQQTLSVPFVVLEGNDETQVTQGDTEDPCRPRSATTNMFVKTHNARIPTKNPQITAPFTYQFTSFHHPQVKNFMRELNRYGVSGVLRRDLQNGVDLVQFYQSYKPTQLVQEAYPTGRVDFAYGGSFAQYNWELFFHLPIHIACRLSADQRFEEARKWFHAILDPTTSEVGGKERFWQFQPFRDAAADVQTLEELLKNETQLAEQVEKWAANPFQPHVVARMRITAYMKFTLMKYLDNLIAWADQLFRRDTIESINEATNLYVIAAKMLGTRPPRIPARATAERQTYSTIKDKLEGLSPTVEIESFLSPSSPMLGSADTGASLGTMAFFCLPPNEQLVRYWDTVADRLFKIRHSLNIEGITRNLPLFEPPIDPALLVRATAAGLDINSLLDANSSANQPHYRFMYMLQKANELVSEIKGLGSALLSALERRDAEALSLLRSGHEQHLLAAVLQVRERQVEEAKEQVKSLYKSKELTQLRETFYANLEDYNKWEKISIKSHDIAKNLWPTVIGFEKIAALLSTYEPKFGSPTTSGITIKGGEISKKVAKYIEKTIKISEIVAKVTAKKGERERKKEERLYQLSLAKKELEMIEPQIIAAEIRLVIAEQELSNHRLQMKQSAETDEFMRTKFTNRQLFDWMAGQVSSLYFQTYQLAYDYAKQTEKCFQLELPHEAPTAGYIKFGYWDNLKQGLMSGEKLQLDLRRLEAAYMEQNTRDLELTKHISLQQLNPFALLQLRELGKCDFAIPEELFDLDFPGHYLRRIKSVSITIPCLAGPYTTINATLRMSDNKLRREPDFSSSLKPVPMPDKTSKMATSSAQNDAGLFELNFRDERYLPFEGAGAISAWTLEMMHDENDPEGAKRLRQFDYHTIADVIVHLRYTAREGDNRLKTDALNGLKTRLNELKAFSENRPSEGEAPEPGLQRLFSLRYDFPNEWHTWQYGQQPLSIKLEKRHFPYLAQVGDISIVQIKAFGQNKDGIDLTEASDETINRRLEAAGFEWQEGANLDKDMDDWYLLVQYSI